MDGNRVEPILERGSILVLSFYLPLTNFGTLGCIKYQMTEAIQLFFTTLTGKHIHLDVLPKSTIAEVKEQICDAEAYPPSIQRLIFDDKKELENDKTVAECGLPSEAVILLLREPYYVLYTM